LSAAKEGIENITEATEASSTERILPTHIVLTTRICITQNFVCVSYRFEFFLGFLGRINIRV
jgi:hypothetical protein